MFVEASRSLNMSTLCYFVTKEFWVINEIIKLCEEFNIPLQYGFYVDDHWGLLYDELQIKFVQFNIVRRRWPCKIVSICRPDILN